MWSLSPHTSHRMQPLDVSFFGPLKMAYKKECDLFLKSHLAEKITPYDVASLVRKAFNNVASISKGETGFRATGIFLLNPEVFTEEDFFAAETLQSENIVIQDCNGALAATSTIPSTSKEFHSPVPSTSKQIDPPVLGMSERVGPLDSESDIISPAAGTSNQISANLPDLIKLPDKTPVMNTRKGRKKHHASTSTPIKGKLLEKENKKMKKSGDEEKEKRWRGKGQGKKTTIQKRGAENAKRQVLQEANEVSVSDVDIDAEDAGNRCLVCNDFGKNNEMWFRCTSFGLWAHAKCTGCNSAEGYVCDMC
ncbi:uncharacterized protein isoform X1 [Leptinotarsa decemlineata]|uniref:uncharacterized protein isoform X1 n=1 Tax=Leptinotarsa decemlineata TaxID=7539 RepID=UPI003D306576